MHFVTGTMGRVTSAQQIAKMVGVCGARYEHQFSFSDVSSLIDCEKCRDWIRRNEKDKGRLKLIEAAWKSSKKSRRS